MSGEKVQALFTGFVPALTGGIRLLSLTVQNQLLAAAEKNGRSCRRLVSGVEVFAILTGNRCLASEVTQLFPVTCFLYVKLPLYVANCVLCSHKPSMLTLCDY